MFIDSQFGMCDAFIPFRLAFFSRRKEVDSLFHAIPLLSYIIASCTVLASVAPLYGSARMYLRVSARSASNSSDKHHVGSLSQL